MLHQGTGGLGAYGPGVSRVAIGSGAYHRSSSSLDGEKAPGTRYAFELMLPPILEVNPGAGH
jgi:hypothetical protein